VTVGVESCLDGSASSDPEGAALSYAWSFAAKPKASKVKLTGRSGATPCLTPDLPGLYAVRLVVRDGRLKSAPATVSLRTLNSPPLADAGSDGLGALGGSVVLDGIRSRDPDGDSLSYQWSLLSAPPASALDASLLEDAEAALAGFVPDQAGLYVAQLWVDDGKARSRPDTTRIVVAEGGTGGSNRNPSITSIPQLTGVAGQAYSYDVDASDPDTGDILGYVLAGAPAGMSIDPVSGLINWTPATGQTGSFAVTVKASDGRGGLATQGYALSIGTPPQPVAVPGLTGLTRSAAEDELREAGLSPGALSFQTSASAADGLVVGQSPAEDTPVAPGAPVDLTVSLGPETGLPPNPATVAPLPESTVAAGTFDATRFLYAGASPLQTGVAEGTIVPEQAAALRGLVVNQADQPLSGVRVSVLGRPEFGQTLSRADGFYDLAVNGGGAVTLAFEKDGVLSACRRVELAWGQYASVPKLAMIAPDGKATAVDLGTAGDKVATGNPVTDGFGTRTAALTLAAGTQCTRTPPGGSSQALDRFDVRLTEFTVGALGPAAMPAALPATSAYTKAIDVGFYAQGSATRITDPVSCDPPLQLRSGNNLGFPPGTPVPNGRLDPDTGEWESDPDGTTSDDGSSQSVPIPGPGQYDPNYGAGVPPGSNPPSNPPPEDDDKDPCESQQGGSIIGCESRTLGEVLDVVGTPFFLRYDSDRVPGRKLRNRLRITLSGAGVSPNLKEIRLEVEVAGRKFEQTFPNTANQVTEFEWDGKDAFGRELPGVQPATVRIGYAYDGFYLLPPSVARSFGLPLGALSTRPTREPVVLWQAHQARVGNPAVAASAPAHLGGWSLSEHHSYDPVGRVLYRGDGEQQQVDTVSAAIATVAGSGALPSAGCGNDSGAATAACLDFPYGVAFAPDGSYYLSDSRLSRLFRVSRDGAISPFAGTGVAGFGGDGGPAAQAQLNGPQGLAVGPDGSVYIADWGNNRIRRVAADGTIATFAGNGSPGDSGDGGPATAAAIRQSIGVTVAVDGSVYIGDANSHRIRRVDPGGSISTFAGTGSQGYSGDGGPAREAQLSFPFMTAVGAGGEVYIADVGNHRIRRVGVDGIITTVAGNGQQCEPQDLPCGDGGPAAAARLHSPTSVAVGRDGSLYVNEAGGKRVRRITPDHVITTFAGSGGCPDPTTPCGDGGPPAQAQLGNTGPDGNQISALAPDGSLYVTDGPNHRLRRIGAPLPGFAGNDIAIPSSDGGELYRFDASGRHLETLNSYTRAVLYRFGYDSAGRLTSITDGDGNVTAIERSGSGAPMAIVGPYGQRTVLTLDAAGYLATVANPAGDTHTMAYGESGLLTRFEDPRGNASLFTYDDLGRLIDDSDAATAKRSLAGTESLRVGETTFTDPLGRSTHYRKETLADGGRIRTVTDPAGLVTTTRQGADGVDQVQAADGTTVTETQSGDPRFGMQVPITARTELKTPDGLTRTTTLSRNTTLAAAADPLSLVTETDTMTLNGRAYTAIYAADTRTSTTTTPEGRQASVTVDAQGRVLQRSVTGLAPVRYSYDARGRLAAVGQGSGADRRTVRLSYGSDGLLSRVLDPLDRAFGYSRDGAGRVLSQTLPGERTLAFEYDRNGNLTGLTPPGRPKHVLAYDALNQHTGYLPPVVTDGGNTGHAYNAARQLTGVTRPDGQTLEPGYDAAGQLATLQTPLGGYGYRYDAAGGQLAELSSPTGGKLAMTHSGSLLTGVGFSGEVAGSVGYAYDSDFRLKEVRVNGGDPVTFGYDGDGLLILAGAMSLSRDGDNGLLSGTGLGVVTDTRTFNGFGETTVYDVRISGGTTLKFEYGYDKLGRITTLGETADGGTATAITYGYDAAGRLSLVSRGGVETRYGYDANGNRTSVNGAAVATYDDQDRLLSYSGATYAYNANGELKSKTLAGAATTYQYDVLGNLRRVDFAGGDHIDYAIDAADRRVGRKAVIGGVTTEQRFLYQDELKIAAELDASNAVVSRFVYGTRSNVPEYMIRGGKTYRIVTDHLGSPRRVIDTGSGDIVQRMDYDAWGQVLADSSPGFQPFGFAGGLYDRDTGLVRFGARDYDPETGRWTAKDPLWFRGGDANLFAYVGNVPVNAMDPTGTKPVERVGGALGILIDPLTGLSYDMLADRINQEDDIIRKNQPLIDKLKNKKKRTACESDALRRLQEQTERAKRERQSLVEGRLRVLWINRAYHNVTDPFDPAWGVRQSQHPTGPLPLPSWSNGTTAFSR
jgi:RHS repeat-associated protein